MKKYILTILTLCIVFVFSVKADNDTLGFVNYCSYDFESSASQTVWKFKSSSGKNKWTIGTPDGTNACLFVSDNATDTQYTFKSASVSVAYTTVTLSATDSLTIEFDANIGGEGAKDFMKVMLVPNDFDIDLPKPNADNLKWAGPYKKDSSFVFDGDKVYVSKTEGRQHFVAKMRNVAPCSTAKLMFIWRNDNVDGDNPAAVVDNIVLKGIVTQVTKTICKGDFFVLGDNEINVSGTYYDTLQTDDNCDSIVCYNIIVKDTFAESKEVKLCFGETYQLFDGTIINSSGAYIDHLQTTSGCDSTIYLNITVNPAYSNTIKDTICMGEHFTQFGFDLTETGIYFDSLKTSEGCDSVLTVDLTVNNTYEKTYSEMICTGDIFNNYGFNESTAGYYTQELQSVNGCDSVIHLNLQVSDVVLKDIYDTMCFGQTYSQNNFDNLTESGVYTDSLQTLSGCDSIIVLHLTVNPTHLTADTPHIAEICQGESVEFCGKTLTTSGHYEEMLQNVYGCDSLAYIDLQVSPTYWIKDSVTIQNGKTYQWNGNTYSQTGDYNDTLQSVNGCDSIVTLCLTVTSSLLENTDEPQLTVYPNPAKDKVYIKLQHSANKGIIYLYDADGTRIKQMQIPANQYITTIHINDLSKGAYILKIETEGKIFTDKLIIE